MIRKAHTSSGRDPFDRGITAVITSILLVLFMALVLPGESERMSGLMPEGASIDTGFAFSPREAISRVAAYSPGQRLAYIHARWTFDLLWPAVYGLAFFSVWSWGTAFLARRMQPNRHRLRWFRIVPLIAVMLDLMENTAATVLMAAGPGGHSVPALILSLSNVGKWAFVSLSMAGALILPPAAAVIKLMKPQLNEQASSRGERHP